MNCDLPSFLFGSSFFENYVTGHSTTRKLKILTVNVTDIKSLNFWDALKDVYVRLIEVD